MKNPFKKAKIDVASKMLGMMDRIPGFQYVRRDSFIHRMSPIIKIALWMVGVALAVSTTDLLITAALAIMCVIYYFSAKLTVKEFWRDTRFIFLLTLSIFGLYILVERSLTGLITGITMGLRTMTIFLPNLVLLRTTTTSELLYSFRKFLPYKIVFALTVAVRFLPYFSKELINIISVQRMRGVNITLKTFLSREGMNCIMIPLTVRGVRTADELSMSISSRAFGAHKKRTHLSDAFIKACVPMDEGQEGDIEALHEKFKRVNKLIARQSIDDYRITHGICLDIGCGAGWMGTELARLTDMTVILLDIDLRRVAEAARNAVEANVAIKTQPIQADVHKLPFRENLADLVVSRGSIFFWEDPILGLKETYRVLKPRGLAFIGGGMGRYLPEEERRLLVAEIKKRIAESGKGEQWNRARRPGKFREWLRKAGIPSFRLTTDSPGLWVEIRKPSQKINT